MAQRHHKNTGEDARAQGTSGPVCKETLLFWDIGPVSPHVPLRGVALFQVSAACLITSMKSLLQNPALLWRPAWASYLQYQFTRGKESEERQKESWEKSVFQKPLQVRRSRTSAPDFTPLGIAQQAAWPASPPAATKADGRVQKDMWIVKNYRFVLLMVAKSAFSILKLGEMSGRKGITKDYLKCMWQKVNSSRFKQKLSCSV